MNAAVFNAETRLSLRCQTVVLRLEVTNLLDGAAMSRWGRGVGQVDGGGRGWADVAPQRPRAPTSPRSALLESEAMDLSFSIYRQKRLEKRSSVVRPRPPKETLTEPLELRSACRRRFSDHVDLFIQSCPGKWLFL